MTDIRGLEEFWRHKTRRAAERPPADRWMAERVMLDTLGLGLEQTGAWLGLATPEREAFEQWILETAGAPDPERVARYHAWLDGTPPPPATAARIAAIDAAPPVLGDAELAQWEEDGYTILRRAIAPDEVAAVAALLWAQIGADPDDPASWYPPNPHGIMVQLFQHPAMEKARRSPRVHKAFAQLWGTADLWATTDRLGFNAPETPQRRFRGPHLHWDVSLTTPIPFGTQGILYLTDTAADQGAFALVPGFHRRIEAWLAGLPEGTDPRMADLRAEMRPIAAGAGDLIIWRQDLPHGATANRGTRPRMVQYVNMYSPAQTRQAVWR